MSRPRRGAVTRVLVVVGLVLTTTACSLRPEAPEPPPSGAAVRGGVLRVAIGTPGSIDPTNVYEPNGELVVGTMCDTLLQQDPSTGMLSPALADSWQVTDDGAKIVLRLREDVTFHDGTEITADDIAATMTRLASEENASYSQEVASLIGGYLEVSGRVEAEPEDRDSLFGIRIVDARSVEVFLRADPALAPEGQMADYAAAFTHLATAPVPAAQFREDPAGFESQPQCAGPYRLAEPWDGGDTIRLTRVESYPAANPTFTAHGAGWVDEIEFHVYDSAADRLAAFERGDVDVVGLLPTQRRELAAPLRDRLVDGTAPGMEFVGVPAGSGASLGTAEIRRALSLAIDRTAIATEVYGGAADPATSLLPPALGVEYAQPGECDVLPATADPARAAQEAGDTLRGTRITLAFNDEGLHGEVLERVAADWEAAFQGLQVELAPMEWSALLDEATGTQGLSTGFRMSWRPLYPGPDQYIGPLYATASVGRSNWSRFSAAQLDTFLDRIARRSADPEELVSNYREGADDICSVVPLIPLVTQRATWLVHEDLEVANGPAVSNATGHPVLREYYWSTDG